MEYRTKEEQVADYLREGIISGRLPRGARLKQTEIAQDLKISITPVREALKLLEAEGYLTSDFYRGATVAHFDVGASREILKLRITLEMQLVESAVRNVTCENIAELRISQPSLRKRRVRTTVPPRAESTIVSTGVSTTSPTFPKRCTSSRSCGPNIPLTSSIRSAVARCGPPRSTESC